VEGGGRTTDFRPHRLPLRDRPARELNDNWNYDVFMQYGTVGFKGITDGFFRTAAINNA
jgi:hypothetical protein